MPDQPSHHEFANQPDPGDDHSGAPAAGGWIAGLPPQQRAAAVTRALTDPSLAADQRAAAFLAAISERLDPPALRHNQGEVLRTPLGTLYWHDELGYVTVPADDGQFDE